MTDILSTQAREALVAGRLVHLATLNSNGSPQVSCVYVGLDGPEIVVGCLSEHRKIHNIRRDGRVSLSVEAEGSMAPGFLNYLVVCGVARVLTGGAPAVLRDVMTQNFGDGSSFPPDGAPEGFVVRITPTSLYGIGPWS